MALQLSKNLKNGLYVENLYIKIISISGNKNKLIIMVGIYLSKESSKNLKEPIEVEEHNFTPYVGNGSDDFIKQGYEYLKTLSEYANAIDVLDEGQVV